MRCRCFRCRVIASVLRNSRWAMEQSLLENSSVFVCEGERPLWEVQPLAPQVPLGDIARALRKEHEGREEGRLHSQRLSLAGRRSPFGEPEEMRKQGVRPAAAVLAV